MRLGSALVAALAVGAVLVILQLRRDAVAETEAYTRQLGVVLAEQTARSVQSIDLVLQEVAGHVRESGAQDSAALHDKFGRLWVHESLGIRQRDLPQVESFTIVDAQGALVNMTRTWPTPAFNLSDRAHFRYFAEGGTDALTVSEVIRNRVDSAPSIYITRALRTEDGRFLGIVSAAVRTAYFTNLFDAIGLAPGTTVAVRRRDGAFLVLSGTSQATPLRSPNPAWQKAVAVGGGHYVIARGLIDAQPRRISVHPLIEYPLVVDVSRSDAAAFAHWRRQAMLIATGTLTAILGIGLILYALQRQFGLIETAQRRISEHADALKVSEARLQTTLETMDQGIIQVGADGFVEVYNRRASELLDLPAGFLANRPSLDAMLAFQNERGDFSGDAQPDPATLRSAHAAYERRQPNGMVLEIRTKPLPGGGLIRTFTDITARAAAEEMLELAASHDELTGLANRNGFNARLDAALAAAQRNGQELTVLCLDLDRFKVVNDTLGHEAGDALLVQVAQRLRQATRESDVVARLGGDEFAVVLPHTDGNAAEQIAERLLESIRAPYALGQAEARVGVSIGYASYPADGAATEQLLRNADSALYRAKADGRNAWRSYAHADGQEIHQRLALERDLRSAVELQQFSLAYQPICDVETGLPVSFEALLRWQHAERGAISPAEFIPVAEQTGLIIPLGHWVIETACTEATSWALPLRISINLSPAQFRERDLRGFIAAVLARTGLAAERLDLEVTEGLLLEDTQAVVETMQGLRALGVRMVLDDFGTAHSSLSYLRGFPFDRIKIDRSFMRALNSDRQARALVEAMLAMARALGLDVVAEGVETSEQLGLLRHLQCRLVQGYLLGRPDTPEAARDWLWRIATQKAERRA